MSRTARYSFMGTRGLRPRGVTVYFRTNLVGTLGWRSSDQAGPAFTRIRRAAHRWATTGPVHLRLEERISPLSDPQLLAVRGWRSSLSRRNDVDVARATGGVNKVPADPDVLWQVAQADDADGA